MFCSVNDKAVRYNFLGTIPLGAEPVYVSNALQKAKIVVNEDGTKAAAATSE